MRNMCVLIDTNILVDFLEKREPYTESATAVIRLCALGKATGYIAAHSISNLFFVLRKIYSVSERRELLKAICGILHISAIDENKILSALQNEDFADFEDCLQGECAKECNADYIITRNLRDFLKSEVKAIMPEEFLKMV
ncbi:MAG: PIN domain-containing protein [Eubacteriales bacterium]|nr:PIN domain-containing protein [Eubacteriales bacterium]